MPPLPSMRWRDFDKFTTRDDIQLLPCYRHLLKGDPWEMLRWVPRGIILEQEMAELVESALKELEKQGYTPRRDAWFLWPWNFTRPTNHQDRTGDGIILKQNPHLTEAELAFAQELPSFDPIMCLQSSIHRAHPMHEATRKRKREDEERMESLGEEETLLSEALREEGRVHAKRLKKLTNDHEDAQKEVDRPKQKITEDQARQEVEKAQQQEKVSNLEKENAKLRMELKERDTQVQVLVKHLRAHLEEMVPWMEAFKIGGIFVKFSQAVLSARGWKVDLGDGGHTQGSGNVNAAMQEVMSGRDA